MSILIYFGQKQKLDLQKGFCIALRCKRWSGRPEESHPSHGLDSIHMLLTLKCSSLAWTCSLNFRSVLYVKACWTAPSHRHLRFLGSQLSSWPSQLFLFYLLHPNLPHLSKRACIPLVAQALYPRNILGVSFIHLTPNSTKRLAVFTYIYPVIWLLTTSATTAYLISLLSCSPTLLCIFSTVVRVNLWAIT